MEAIPKAALLGRLTHNQVVLSGQPLVDTLVTVTLEVITTPVTAGTVLATSALVGTADRRSTKALVVVHLRRVDITRALVWFSVIHRHPFSRRHPLTTVVQVEFMALRHRRVLRLRHVTMEVQDSLGAIRRHRFDKLHR